MNVWLIAQYFPPETGAPPNRMASIVEAFLDAGHAVHVIAAKPNHPEGVIWPEYRGRLFQERIWKTAPVTHTWVFTSEKKNVGGRTFNYLSFMFMAVLAGLRIDSRPDVILASTPPPFVGVSGWLLARLKGAKFLFDVRDLWPGLAIALGELKNPLAIWLARRLERFLYRRADGLTAVTEPFCREIARIAGPEKPVVLSMNGTTTEFLNHDHQRDVVRMRMGWEGKFVVMYSGNLGVCQGLDHVIDAAHRVRDIAPQAHFHFVGAGPRRQQLMDRSKAERATNVAFTGRVTQTEAIQYMAAADALLVPLAANEMCETFIPSKLFDSMAMGLPVLLSVGGEAKRILETAGGGTFYPPEDPEALTRAVLSFMNEPNEAAILGQAGRRYVTAHCLRRDHARRLVNLAETMAGLPVANRTSVQAGPAR